MPGQLCAPNTASIGNLLEQAVLDHLARAAAAFLGRLEDRGRRCRRSCGASPGAWPRRAASRCGRRGRRRASCRGAVLACAKVLCSVIGSASMSARRPTARSLVPFFRMPTTPVVPRPRWIGMPQSVSCLAITSAVRCSSKHSSGWAWMSRRIAAMARGVGEDGFDELHGGLRGGAARRRWAGTQGKASLRAGACATPRRRRAAQWRTLPSPVSIDSSTKCEPTRSRGPKLTLKPPKLWCWIDSSPRDQRVLRRAWRRRGAAPRRTPWRRGSPRGSSSSAAPRAPALCTASRYSREMPSTVRVRIGHRPA